MVPNCYCYMIIRKEAIWKQACLIKKVLHSLDNGFIMDDLKQMRVISNNTSLASQLFEICVAPAQCRWVHIYACFTKAKNMAVENNQRVEINFLEKPCLLVETTWSKRKLSKQVAPIIHTLEKMFLRVITFRGYWNVPFQTE